MCDPCAAADRPTDEAPEPPCRPEARARFVDECSATIRRPPGVRPRSQADREGRVQEVLMGPFRRLGRDRSGPPSSGLVPRIMAVLPNKAADVARRRNRSPEVAFGDGTVVDLADRGPEGPDPDGPGRGEAAALAWQAPPSLDHRVLVTSDLASCPREMEGGTVTGVASQFRIAPEQARFRRRVERKAAAMLAHRRELAANEAP